MIRFLLLSTLFLLPGSLLAEEIEINHAQRYQTCMSLIETDAEAAFDNAIHWAGLGGGDAAEHCTSAALVALGHYDQGAARLEELAHRVRRDVSFKVRLLEQSAQASLLGGNTVRARAVLTSAIALAPDDPWLLVERARAIVAEGGLSEAIADLDRALAIDPANVDALVYSGSARRLSGDLVAAEAALTRALELDPDHPEGLLERGILHRLQGDDQSARIDWLQAALNAPGTDVARAARRNIELLDVPQTEGPSASGG